MKKNRQQWVSQVQGFAFVCLVNNFAGFPCCKSWTMPAKMSFISDKNRAYFVSKNFPKIDPINVQSEISYARK